MTLWCTNRSIEAAVVIIWHRPIRLDRRHKPDQGMAISISARLGAGQIGNGKSGHAIAAIGIADQLGQNMLVDFQELPLTGQPAIVPLRHHPLMQPRVGCHQQEGTQKGVKVS